MTKEEVAWLHTLVCRRASRQQYFGTFFLRNRPALELIRGLCEQKADGESLRIAVSGCNARRLALAMVGARAV